MPNRDTPRGFEAINLKSEDVHRYYKIAGSFPLGIGDPVVRVANSTDPQGYPAVARQSALAITGVVVGVETAPGRSTKYLASTDAGYVLVADNPNQLFRVQDNGGATGITIANLGEHVASVAAINCNTTTGVSNYEIDTEGLLTGNTWVLVRKDDSPNNVVGANCDWIVRPNVHTDANASVTNSSSI